MPEQLCKGTRYFLFTVHFLRKFVCITVVHLDYFSYSGKYIILPVFIVFVSSIIQYFVFVICFIP